LRISRILVFISRPALSRLDLGMRRHAFALGALAASVVRLRSVGWFDAVFFVASELTHKI
jgi:hypothetical protein